MVPLTSLPAVARVRLLSMTPALATEHSAALLSAIDKLFAQFIREDRISAFGADVLGDGHVLAVAWVDEKGPLSGCSHDKLGQILRSFEERTGSNLLAAPPIVIESSAGLRCVDRAGLKTLVSNNDVTPDSIHWDLRCETLASWQQDGRRPARETWLGPLIQRAQQAH